MQNGPFGPISYSLGNGLTNVLTYDSSGRSLFKWLCAGGVTTSFCTGGTQLYGFNTSWKGSYLTHGIDTTENSGGDYTYDAFGHMTAYTGTQGQPTSYSYTYDRYGNRLSATPGANIAISKSTNLITTAGFVNDAAGNTTGDGVHTYAYDAENNLTSVDGGSTAKYFYNALNQRVEIDNSQGSHEFTYDVAGRRITTWLPGSLTGIQGQIWWGSTPIAYRDIDGSTYFQQGDWVGTQRLLTNYAGSVVSAYTSRPWGEAYTTTGKDDNISHYAGLEQSENTGIQHATYRDYDSSLGRWQSPDSYTGSYDLTNPQSFNRFSYAGNAPNSNTDPSGQMFIFALPGGGGGGGGVYYGADPNQGGFGSGWDEFGSFTTVCGGNGCPIYSESTWNQTVADQNALNQSYDGGVPGITANEGSLNCPSGLCGVYATTTYWGMMMTYDQMPQVSVSNNGCIVVNGKSVCPSPIDKRNIFHPGKLNYRDNLSHCSTHVIVDPLTGQVVGTHVDEFNPNTYLLEHTFLDVIPDMIYDVTGDYLFPAGRSFCP